MCLFVEQLPTSSRAANCVPCWKDLIHEMRGWEKQWVTPYFLAPVPSDGILTPSSRRLSYDLVAGAQINGGAIHARTEKKADLVTARRLFRTRFNAYAFGVLAYGEGRDLACALLYIPKLDKKPGAKERKAAVEAWAGQWERTGEGPTNKQVRQVFPQFKPVPKSSLRFT